MFSGQDKRHQQDGRPRDGGGGPPHGNFLPCVRDKGVARNGGAPHLQCFSFAKKEGGVEAYGRELFPQKGKVTLNFNQLVTFLEKKKGG